jgi:2,3-bisphosphoglycerate-dependent phosphoglycerate mutase
MKQFFLVRHCKAAGQEPDAKLTIEGFNQSLQLAGFLSNKRIDLVISSPFVRAIETIKPFCQQNNIPYIVEARLSERVLSLMDLDDWMDKLEQTYFDLDLKFVGGESSNDAMTRGIQVIDEALERPESNIVLVTHGGLMSFILKYYNNDFGFEDWRKISNPDVYSIQHDSLGAKVTRMWGVIGK